MTKDEHKWRCINFRFNKKSLEIHNILTAEEAGQDEPPSVLIKPEQVNQI